MIIHSSRKNMFLVKKVQTKDILDFQSWWPEFTNKMQFLLKAPMAKKGQRKTLQSHHTMNSSWKSQKGQLLPQNSSKAQNTVHTPSRSLEPKYNFQQDKLIWGYNKS